MTGYKVVWVGGHNGHWEIYKGNEFVVSCDDNELKAELENLEVSK